jgi:hypothetical protein
MIRAITEGAVAVYPAIDGVEAEPLPFLWRRVEAWTAHRFAPREVVITAEGPGVFRWPLAPVVEVLATERWVDGFEPVTLAEGPEGFELLSGHYRLTATIGAGPVPADVAEAVKRLARYVEAEGGLPGSNLYSLNLGQVSENFRRSPTWLGRAMEWSGAADLLRGYRRA